MSAIFISHSSKDNADAVAISNVTDNGFGECTDANSSNTAATADVTDTKLSELRQAVISNVTESGSAKNCSTSISNGPDCDTEHFGKIAKTLIGNRAYCAGCKRQLEPAEPVYRTRLLVPWSFYLHGSLQKGASWKHQFVCEACIRPEKGRYRKSHSCLACGRLIFIHRGVQCADYCSYGCQLDAANQRRRRRSAKRRRDQRHCTIRGDSFKPKRTDSEYCSAACKQSAYRQRLKANITPEGKLT
jgi:hypothetical protein